MPNIFIIIIWIISNAKT